MRASLFASPSAAASPPSTAKSLASRLHAAAPRLKKGVSHLQSVPKRAWCRASILLLLLGLIAFVLGTLDWRWAKRAGPAGNKTPEIDVVMVALKPTCVNRAAVAALQRYVRPRTLHVVTATARQCTAFRSWGLNIACHLQDAFLPGVTKGTVAEGLARRFSADGAHRFRGRDMTGWYLQQFLKLGAAAAIQELSEHFLVWDSDMIPLRPLKLLHPAPGASTPGISESEAWQTVVQVGGVPHVGGYAQTYEKLLGVPLLAAPDGSSFVTHCMVMFRPYVEELLAAVTYNITTAPPPPMWVDAILDALPPHHLDLGFSEYATYASFVRARHPRSQRLAGRKAWLRYGLGGEAAIRLGRTLSPGDLCCPSRHALLVARLLGFEYSGLDVGHVLACRFDAPEHALSYGVDLPEEP
eukprot:CAMPEP_0206152494 /NCGR_PEP_ID=MMETSP1473-20131121/39354_1 /ASSEMBLY_ACC=CAM_ASM_001109 /TAXON_ID=1461547 /ORGANISM="Stichococcus sp, Strain RCC1054" /LENGTH=411 /DNA_ID=CAMNT_0053550053 /DNA_START=219 /DNA_END=1454 /DNA_ORIENTATION=+